MSSLHVWHEEEAFEMVDEAIVEQSSDGWRYDVSHTLGNPGMTLSQ